MRDQLNIPVVMVVMQGSIGASTFLLEGLKAGTPAVVVYGSGGVCDVIVNLVRHSKDVARKHLSGRYNPEKRNRRRMSIGESPAEICTCLEGKLSVSCHVSKHFFEVGNFDKFTRNDPKFFSNVMECVTKHADLLILFDLEDENYDGLDAALLEALVKVQNVSDSRKADSSGSQSPTEQKANLSGIQVALGWNRPDFAERLLKASDNTAKDEVALGSILMHALAWNLHEFSELLLAHDASVPMVAANAIQLYNSNHQTGHLKRFMRFHVGQQGTYTKDDVDDMINRLSRSRNGFNSNVSNESDPYFELTLWATLSLYPELAYVMWKGTQEPIRVALFVVMLLKRLSSADKVIVTSMERKTLARMQLHFEELAVSLLSTLHDTDSTVCEKALNSAWQRLNNATYIEMAFQGRARDFIAHPACQQICERRWQGGLASEVNIFKVILVTLFPFLLASPVVTFRSRVTKGDTDCCGAFSNKARAWFSSPCVKFWFGVITYIAFAVFQTHVILTGLTMPTAEPKLSPMTIVYLVWLVMLICDELVQVITRTLQEWLRNIFNRVDTFMYTLVAIGIVLVHVPVPDGTSRRSYDTGRMFLSAGSVLFYIRLLHMFTLDSALGPTLLMIQRMLHDFKVFLVMFCFVAVAFGVGYAVALTDPADWTKPGGGRYSYSDKAPGHVAGIFYYTFFQMYGEIFAEDLTQPGKYFPEEKGNGRPDFVVALIGIYMMIVVLMLVNILIAMFSDTYTRVKDREEVIFKFQRLELLIDTEHSLLPPPFSFFHLLFTKVFPKPRTVHMRTDRWKDTVIRSAVVDCLEDHLKKERCARSSETEVLLRESTKMLKGKLAKLQKYTESIQTSINNLTSQPVSANMLPEDVEDEDV